MKKVRNIRRRNRFVAFLDIMGTKKLLEQGQDKRIVQLLESIRNIERDYGTDDYVRMSFFSDSIILFTIDDGNESFRSILYTCAQIVDHFLTEGFGINGCISHGVCTCDYKEGKYITVGKPFANAYQTQEKLWCYGVVIDKHAMKKMHNGGYNADIEKLLLDMDVELEMPSKTEGWITYTMVNWMEFIQIGNGDMKKQKDDVKAIVHNLYKKHYNVGKGAIYIQNTEIVMKQWYDFKDSLSQDCAWGKLLYEEYLSKCPE